MGKGTQGTEMAPSAGVPPKGISAEQASAEAGMRRRRVPGCHYCRVLEWHDRQVPDLSEEVD